MATFEQPAYRKAIDEARARAREIAAARTRERRRRIGILAGSGLSFVLLGGVAGGYMALSGDLADAAGLSAATSSVVKTAEPASARIGIVRIAPTETTGQHVVLPPVAALLPILVAPGPRAALSENQRQLLSGVLEAVSDTARNPPAPDARKALLARLNVEPLKTAADPTLGSPVAPAGAERADLPPPSPPKLDQDSRPAWQRYAVPVTATDAQPMIAVVLDDLGLNRAGTNRAIALPAPLTLAFMTYAEGLPRMAARARRAGHELMLHMPMAPRDPTYNPGPNVLRAELAPAELARRLDWGLGRFEGFVGVNNHMGSRFTASRAGMAPVMAALRARGLLFLDSLTSSASVGVGMARRAGVPYAARDVFLDNEWNDQDAIARQFAHLEAVARRRGSAIGIGHPHRATLDVLVRWLPEARARGFAIVPVSAIVQHRRGPEAQFVDSSR